MKNKIYIIVLNYNGWKDTIECLESVLKNDYENYQIIVVDNESPNNSMDKIMDWAEGKQEVVYEDNSQLKHLSQPFKKKPLKYVFYTKDEALKGGIKEKEEQYKNPLIFIQSGENGGFAAGNNIGIQYALAKDDFDYICLLNNDTVIEHNALSLVVEKMIKDNNIGICSSKIKYYDNPFIIWSNGGIYDKILGLSKHIDYLKYDNGQAPNRQITFLTGCMWVVKKDVWLKVGLLNENYFMYVEDLEYSQRVIQKKYALSVEHRSIIYHKIGASTGSETSYFSAFYMMRNRVFYSKYNLNIYYKITSLLFLFSTRIIKFPLFIMQRRFYLVKAQLKGIKEGLLK